MSYMQCRLQMQLGSGVAVAVVYTGSCSSDLIPRPGNFHMPRGKKKKKKIPGSRRAVQWVKDPALSQLWYSQKRKDYITNELSKSVYAYKLTK